MKEGLREEKGKNIYGSSWDAGIFLYTVKIKLHFSQYSYVAE